MKRIIQLVDENDNFIGLKPYEEIDYSKDIYRVSSLWLTNSKGEILIAQRKHTKLHDPLKWSGAVSGTIEEGETYESNIYKETEEEIGLTGQKLTIGPKQFVVNKSRKFFNQWFFCTVDKDVSEFRPQEDEVEMVEWISQEKLVAEVSQNPGRYIESMPSVVKLLVK